MTLPKNVLEREMSVDEFMIDSDTAGIKLYVRNKRPRSMTEFSAEKTVLFVHGSTYPAETAFDLRLNDLSWMEYIASHGYDGYLVDVRGYGASVRPPEMDQPAQTNAPIVRADVAVRDVGSAVDFILDRRNLKKISLIGWSWGTTLMGAFTAANNDKVNKLVLYAPQWIRTTPSLSDLGGDLGAYRVVSIENTKGRWLTGVPEDKKATLIPPGWFEAWAEATFATDPWGNAQMPKKLRAPNGTVQDSREVWSQGKSIYDPGQITVPVLLVHADWDQDLPLDMARTYFSLLTSAPYRRWVEIGEGTHTLIMEKNRFQLFGAVQAFLDESFCCE
ncbi:pimeloyl-ACP methyl ester carboxylesterase [Nitrobacteraceae bacterium AZCC 2146]